MTTVAISQFRNNLPKFIDEVASYMKRFVITVSGKPKAVVLSPEELESLEETAEIMAVPGTYKKIKKSMKQARQGKLIPLKDLKI